MKPFLYLRLSIKVTDIVSLCHFIIRINSEKGIRYVCNVFVFDNVKLK